MKLIDCGKIEGAAVGPVGRRVGAMAVSDRHRQQHAHVSTATQHVDKQYHLQGWIVGMAVYVGTAVGLADGMYVGVTVGSALGVKVGCAEG